MLYSCTHKATVGVQGLTYVNSHTGFLPDFVLVINGQLISVAAAAGGFCYKSATNLRLCPRLFECPARRH